MLQTIRIIDEEVTPLGRDTLADIRRLGLGPFDRVATVKVYRVEGFSFHQALAFARAIIDPGQRFTIDEAVELGAARLVEVGYKPGVMNPESASLLKVGRDLGLVGMVAADSSVEYHFFGTFGDDEVQTVLDRLLVNKTVQRVITETPATLVIEGGADPVIRTVPIRTMDPDALMALSNDALFFDLSEMQAVQAFFVSEGRDARDAELEVTGVFWSEHCSHKTFKAPIRTPEGPKPPFMTRLKETAARFSRGTISAFIDNAGVARFYEGWAINAKVETHNSPSAVEPYGGAATGTGGVLRDVDDTGEGAQVIASTDVFCLAPPTLPLSEVPPGCLHPDYLLRRVVAGVGDYGNRMGVPTNNGSFHFHSDFRAKPSVIVGAYGLLPEARATKGVSRPGDLVVVTGGRTGRDGVHGATFSSGEMTDRTAVVHGAAVQIGNAIEEKRMFDAGLALRDRGFVRARTDCGAGGFASAVGEMGSATGVHLELDTAPLKYAGLAPWEILISESQERTIFAIAPEHVEEALDICRRWNVEATVIGTFTETRRFVATYRGEVACDLPYSFLEEGRPERELKARSEPQTFAEPVTAAFVGLDLAAAYHGVMGHLNVCSKEPIVRRYDHSVQGTNALPPYGGVHHDAPNDAAVLRPLHDRPYGIIIAHGANPVLNRLDPYWGAIWAGVEALANLVAVGGNVREGETWLIDNFIWPYPTAPMLGALDRAVDACVTLMETFGTPFISGKDSLSSTYRRGNVTIEIPPVMCVSAFGRIPDVERSMSADFKRVGSHILLVGNPDYLGMGGSVFYDLHGCVGERPPRANLAELPLVFATMHEWITTGKVRAAHDVSEGGIAAALAEMCFGGDVGAKISLDFLPSAEPWRLLLNETPGCFLIETSPSVGNRLTRTHPRFVRYLGTTVERERITVVEHIKGRELCAIPLATLKAAWQRPMEEVFGHAA